MFQCTCLAVSRKWLALGTSAGGLHLIQKEDWKQKLILTHKVYNYTRNIFFCKSYQRFTEKTTFSGGIHCTCGLLPSRRRLCRCCNKVSLLIKQSYWFFFLLWSYFPCVALMTRAYPARVWSWCGSCIWSDEVVRRGSACRGSTEVRPSQRSVGTPVHSESLWETLEEK